jgi:hypothetical protein
MAGLFATKSKPLAAAFPVSCCDFWTAGSSTAVSSSMGRIPFGILKGRTSAILESAILEVAAMSLAEVLPEVQSLSRGHKIRLVQFLAQELERDDGGLIEAGRSYPIWSPDRDFIAAEALLQALAADRGQH